MRSWLKTQLEHLKKAYKSLTIWWNVAGSVLLAASLADPMVASYLTAHGFVWVIILGNMALRFKTTKALSHK